MTSKKSRKSLSSTKPIINPDALVKTLSDACKRCGGDKRLKYMVINAALAWAANKRYSHELE